SRLLHIGHRVSRRLAVAHLEVQMRRSGVAGLSDEAHDLSTHHLIALAYPILQVVGVYRPEAIVVAHDDHVAIAADAVAGTDHLPCGRGVNRRATRRGDVDAFVRPAFAHAKATRDNA